MTIEVVGAGLGRTGTHSLKIALEQLLGGRCYHMTEVFGRPDDPEVWAAAFTGNPPDWSSFLSEYTATVDWPAAAAWQPISAAFPTALILLSTRDADAWWQSASSTIFQAMKRPPETDAGGDATSPPGPHQNPAWQQMNEAMLALFTTEWADADAAKAAYLAHNQRVRDTADPSRLLEWHPGDGWEPICEALGRPVPDEPFPHVNTTEQFRAMVGLDAPA